MSFHGRSEFLSALIYLGAASPKSGKLSIFGVRLRIYSG